MDGKANTLAYVTERNRMNNSNYAAGYCYNYTTTGTTVGDWYLPAAGEWNKIHENILIVSNAGAYINSNLYAYHHSSTETGANSYYYYDPYNKSIINGYNKTTTAYVRCLLEF